MSKETKLYPIAYRGFSSNSLFTVASNIEKTIDNDIVYYTDVIFLTFRKGDRNSTKMSYKKDSEISAKVDSISLRAFALGIKSSLKNISLNNYKEAEPIYKDRTATTEFDISSTNKKIYLNIRDLTKEKNYIGVEIELFKLLSLADSMIIIADLTEKYLYSFQRDNKTKSGENK